MPKTAEHVPAYKLHKPSGDGRPSGHLHTIKQALHVLRQSYASKPASEFVPLAFQALQHQLVQTGNARSYVNKLCDTIRSGSALRTYGMRTARPMCEYKSVPDAGERLTELLYESQDLGLIKSSFAPPPRGSVHERAAVNHRRS